MVVVQINLCVIIVECSVALFIIFKVAYGKDKKYVLKETALRDTKNVIGLTRLS